MTATVRPVRIYSPTGELIKSERLQIEIRLPAPTGGATWHLTAWDIEVPEKAEKLRRALTMKSPAELEACLPIRTIDDGVAPTVRVGVTYGGPGTRSGILGEIEVSRGVWHAALDSILAAWQAAPPGNRALDAPAESAPPS